MLTKAYESGGLRFGHVPFLCGGHLNSMCSMEFNRGLNPLMTARSTPTLKRGAWRPPVLNPVGIREIREHYSRFPRRRPRAKFYEQRCWPKPTPIPPRSTMGPRTNADRPDILHSKYSSPRSDSRATRTVENEIRSWHIV